jgi:hypothetical protein
VPAETTAQVERPAEKAPEPELPFAVQPAAGETSLELDLAGLLEAPAESAAEGTEAPESVEIVTEHEATEVGLPALEVTGVAAEQPDLAALLSYDNLQSMQFGEAEAAAVPAEEPVQDFERDLTALGLGEIPPELLAVPSLEDLQPIPLLDDLQPVPTLEGAPGAGPEPEAFAEVPPLPTLEIVPGAALPEIPAVPAEEASPQGEAGSEPVIDLDALAATLGIEQPLEITAAETPVEATVVPETPVSEAPDFADLLQSLDEMEAEPLAEAQAIAEAEPVAGFDADLLAELAAEVPARVEEVEQTTGVISTDAFMEDIGGEMLGVGLGDELSALTGAERPKSARPTASVNKIPEAGSGVIHRDDRVDRDTVMKIIDGIKNL